MKYPSLALAAVALLAVAPTPPPPPPTLTPPTPAASIAPADASATPSAAASPSASPSPNALDSLFGPGTGPNQKTPPKGVPKPPQDARVGLSGVWEIQIQRGGVNVDYEHFALKQTGTTLSGTYLTQDKKKYPVAGAVDGTNVRLIVSLPDGSTMLFEGRADGTTDMIGMLTDSKERVPFTAAYRPKEKWFDNINPGTGLGGGLGSGGGYPPR
ncbi:MAG: hypothetical protein KGN02_06735 [bacterium]|nr:hypothetical protein [bacterium]